MGDLFRSRMCIVYGTRRPARTGLLRRIATATADWRPGPGSPFGSTLGGYAVLSDKEALPAATAGYSLLLIGGPEDNSLARRLAPSLPVDFGHGAIAVGGQAHRGSGAALVLPNPESPGFLLGIISLPFPAAEAESCMRRLLAPLRADPAASPQARAFRTPDLDVFDKSGRRLWAGSFGAEWKELKSWYE